MANILYCTSFVLEQHSGTHDLSTDTIKIALFKDAAALTASTTAYSTTEEATSGTGYTAGGATLSLTATYPKTESGRAATRFEDVSWTFTAVKQIAYGLVYNSSKSNKAIMVMDFGTGRSFTGSFAISFPLTQQALITSAA